MSIIAQNVGDVNIYIDVARRKSLAAVKRAERRADEKKPPQQRWSAHKRDAMRVSDKLLAVGLYRRAYRMRSCAQQLIGVRCMDCGNFMVTEARYCRDRLCPVCNWRLSIKRYGQMTQLMSALFNAYPEVTYSLITLTVRNTAPEHLDETLQAMQRAWCGVRQQRWARTELIGWARSIEVTYNSVNNTLHPHYHILAMTYKKSSADRVIDTWITQARKQDLVVSYAAQHCDNIIEKHTEGASLAGAVCEVYKYMVKSSDELEMPLGTFRAFANEIAGHRLVSFGGKIKEYAKLLELEDMEENSEEEHKEIEMCGRCRSQALDEIVMEWSVSANTYIAFGGCSGTVYIDDEAYHTSDKAEVLELMQIIRDKAVSLDEK